MSKRAKIIIVVVLAPLFTYSFLGQLGIFIFYNNPSIANEPTLKINSKMLVSNLVKPKVGDFVCFKYRDEQYGFGDYIKVNRLSALENDTLEIKNGILYVNSINTDEDLNLMNNYKVPNDIFVKLENDKILTESITYGRINEEIYIVSLDKKTAKKYNLLENRVIDAKVSEQVKKKFHHNWNFDNFGPIIIPKGKFFVLGDNRVNSMDSRMVGLVDLDKIVGIVIIERVVIF